MRTILVSLVSLVSGLLDALMFLIVSFLWAAVMAIPVMLLWDYTVPWLFPGTKGLDFWHAMTLFVLCNVLFKQGNKSKSSD